MPTTGSVVGGQEGGGEGGIETKEWERGQRQSSPSTAEEAELSQESAEHQLKPAIL